VPVQGSFVENDHVIEALAANRADDTFNVCSLPWRSRRAQYLPHSQLCQLLAQLGSEYSVPVPKQIFRRLIKWKRLA
jgi:hypothetical protein